MRAGLVPRLRASGVPAFLEDGSDAIHSFASLTVVPREMGEDLCNGLARALYRQNGRETSAGDALAQLAAGDYPSPEAYAALAASSPHSAAAPILRALERRAAQTLVADDRGVPQTHGLLLAIDQLEEIFARPEADRQAFIRLLVALTATGKVWVTATMRNDFYDRLRQDSELSSFTDCGKIYDLLPPGRADYREIIRSPAQAAGLIFEIDERRDLAADIEDEAGSEGALPMIAFLLEQLFQERRGNVLTFETYDRLGGAAGALAQQGEQTFREFSPEMRQAVPGVVRRLVRKGFQDLSPTATAAPLSVFPNGSPERQLIDALSAARLMQMFTILAGEGSAASVWVRWSHEALLTRWPKLRDLVDADRRDYETLDRVQSAHSLWERTAPDQKHERLLTDLALAEARDLLDRWGADIDEPLRQFITASHIQAQRRRRRRRHAVIAAVATLSVLATLASIASIVALRQRNLALAERTAADHTARFMVALFKIADPGENRGSSVTVRELLDRGAVNISKGLEKEPAIRADLLTAMGQAYSGLGLYDPAKKLLAMAEADQSGGTASAESRVRTLDAAGANLVLAADYEQAAKLLSEAVRIARLELPAQSELRSQSLDDLADVQSQLENYTEAESLCREALKADRKRGPDGLPVLARTLDVLGSIYYFSGDLPAAESALRESVAIEEQAFGARDSKTALTMNNLAAALYQAGDYDASAAIWQKALSIYQEVYGPDHPEVAVILNNAGRGALMAGHVQDAELLLRQALSLDERLKDSAHDDLVPPLNSLAMIDGYTGDLHKAREEIERAEQIARLPNHGQLLDQVLLNRADLELRGQAGKQAGGPLAESRRILEAKFPIAQHPSDAWRYAIWDTVNAEWLAQQSDVATARRTLAAALPVIEQRFGAAGFHSLLARRRAQFIEAQAGPAPKR
jgi:tetratricopeptide (TPR) repeat protein